MTKINTVQLCVIAAAVILVGMTVYFCIYKKKDNLESYTTAGSLDHLDSLDGRYETIQSPDEAVPAEHFADLVDSGDHMNVVEQQSDVSEDMRPFERLERLQGKDMLPLTAAHVPQYNVDVANPSTYSFATSAPRVLLKNRLNMQADPLRGDVPIRYHPDIALIAKSSNGRDSWRGDGFFSDHFNHLYNKYTGRAYKNMPLKVATEGTIADYIDEQ